MDLDPTHSNGFLKYKGAIVHISKFDKSVNTKHILAPFIEAGVKLEDLEVIWVDDEGLFVSISSVKHWDEVKNSLNFPNEWAVKPYAQFLQEKGSSKIECKRNVDVFSSLIGLGRTLSNSFFGSFIDGTDAASDERSIKRRRSLE